MGTTIKEVIARILELEILSLYRGTIKDFNYADKLQDVIDNFPENIYTEDRPK